MTPPDPVSALRHAIANPLSALLAESQLALMDAEEMSPRTHSMSRMRLSRRSCWFSSGTSSRTMPPPAMS